MNTAEETLAEPSKTEASKRPVPEGSPAPLPPAKGRSLGVLLFITLMLFGGAFVFGLMPRVKERKQVEVDTKELSQPNVVAVRPAPAKAGLPLVLSGELRPAMEASINARVNGYVRKWNADLGAKVEAGQLLAELDTPDTDRELSQAKAQLLQAEAARDLAGATAKRWKEMLGAKTVSAQEADEKASDFELKKAAVEAARAYVQRIEQVAGFGRITAPFAGTITRRGVDVDELITAGAAQELFHLAHTDHLRVFVRVPQNYARSVEVGQIGELTIAEAPGRKFEAKVARTAGALDPATRTLLTELEVDNRKGELLTGSYAQVRLPEAKTPPTLTVPANTIMFRNEGPQVAVVVNDRVSFRTVSLGRDYGSSLEVRSGVEANDQIVVNPNDALSEGATVHAVEAKQ
jgi:membrane fusion protein (multidrug efflux system)